MTGAANWNKTENQQALFDLATDSQNNHNVAAEHPELVAQFSQTIEDWIAAGEWWGRDGIKIKQALRFYG